MFDLTGIDVKEVATALADQTGYEHRWLVDTQTGEVVFWTSDTGIDDENPVEIEELDLVPIDPIGSYVWYQDMADFAEGASATMRPADAWEGRSKFGVRSVGSRISSMSTTPSSSLLACPA